MPEIQSSQNIHNINNRQSSASVSDDILIEQGRRIRALHEIISRPGLSFDQQIDETLRLGCRLLGCEIGKVGRQDPEKNSSEFLNTIVLSDLPARRGVVLPLDKTFCQVTFSSPQAIAISHVAESEYKDHPAAAFLGMQSYIGCSIHVHGKKFGTVNFSNRVPVDTPFSESDLDLVNLIGSWISVMMERQLETEELRQSKEAADAANQSKSEFLANMSHEIRTPLTAIVGYADMLRDKDQSADDREHCIDSIIRAGAHLQRIINDILDLSKIEANHLTIEQIELEPTHVMYDVESIFGTRARDKGLDFEMKYEFPLPVTICSDPTRLKQVIFNLCGNALKFTRKGGVEVRMAYLPETRQLSFIVQDTGIGMTQEEASHLFVPFSQADTSITRRFGGTGLGLCIARQLALHLGGDVSVQSEKGVGSCFEFTLAIGAVEPILANSMDDIREKPANENVTLLPNSVRGHVLVADDSPEIRDLIVKYLHKAGATVEAVDNGLIAMQKALNGSYDLIIMDMQMPVMDGLTATKKLRNEGYTGPIVSLTANAVIEAREQCLAVGFNDYLSKPIKAPLLYETLLAYLKPVGKNIGVA